MIRETRISIQTGGDTFSWLEFKDLMESGLAELNAIEGSRASVHVDQRSTEENMTTRITLRVTVNE